MSITYPNDVQPVFESGITEPQAIADALNADGRTHRDIDLGELLHVMNFRRMLQKYIGSDTAKKWEGSVIRLRDAMPLDHEAAASFAAWLSHITDQRQKKWQTTKREFADPFLVVFNQFANPPSDAFFQPGDLQEIYKLGGGRLYGDVTAEDVSSAIHLQQLEDGVEIIRQKANAAVAAAEEESRKQDATKASVVAAGQTVWE